MDQHPGQALQRVHGLGAGRWPLGLVGPGRHRLRAAVVRQPFQRDGIPRTVAREPGGEGAIVLRHPHGAVPVESGVRPRQHPGGRLLIEQREAHEEPEHGAAERFG